MVRGIVRTGTRFDYMLLGRLKMDCDYFLGFGNRDASKLWAGSIEGQLQKMTELWEKCKPFWLKRKKLNQYKRKMLMGERKWK